MLVRLCHEQETVVFQFSLAERVELFSGEALNLEESLKEFLCHPPRHRITPVCGSDGAQPCE